MKRKALVLLVLALIALPVVAQQGARSKVETKSLFSKVLNAEREYTIYLPKSYDVNTDKKYPILYLLHGMTDTSTQWYNRGHLKDVMDLLTASGEACEMIVVTPCAGGSIESDARKDQLRSIAWFVDCGDDDFLIDRNIEFTQAMRKAGIPCEFRVRNGGHVWEYWNQALYFCLPFVTRNFTH